MTTTRRGLALAAATFATACNGLAPPAPKPPAKSPAAAKSAAPGPGVTPAVGVPSAGPSSASFTRPAATLIRGTVLAPSNMVSAAKGGMLSDAGGGMLSDAGGGVIANNGGAILADKGLVYRIMADGDRPFTGVEVFLADRAGTPLPGLPAVKTDQLGRYEIPDVPAGHGMVVVARFTTKNGSTGLLQTMVSTTGGAARADVDGATTLVTAAVNAGRSGVMGAFTPATFDAAVLGARQQLASNRPPNWTDVNEIVAAAQALIGQVAELKSAVESLQAETARLNKRIDELEAEVAALKAAAAATPTPPPAGPTAAPTRFVATTYAVGKAPTGVVFAPDGSMWIACQGADALQHLGVDGQTLGTVALPAKSQPVMPYLDPEGNLWTTCLAAGNVLRLTTSGTLLGTYPVGKNPSGLLPAKDGSLWIVNMGGDALQRLDGKTGAVAQTIAVGKEPQGLAFDSRGKLWVSNHGDGTVMRVDGAKGVVEATYPVGAEPRGMAFDGSGSVWVQLGDGTLSRLADADGAPLGRFDAGQALSFAMVDRRRQVLWASATASDRLLEINYDGRLLTSVSVGKGPLVVTLAPNGDPWVTSLEHDTITHVRPE